MPTFPSRPYTPPTALSARYRRLLARHPFLTFGLPFLSTILAGSFFLTPATALRYERHDRKVQRVGTEERLGLGIRGVNGEKEDEAERERRLKRGRGDLRDEYYRLAGRDLEGWEQRRALQQKLRRQPFTKTKPVYYISTIPNPQQIDGIRSSPQDLQRENPPPRCETHHSLSRRAHLRIERQKNPYFHTQMDR
ncbi:MAG: Cytochrome oxidase assembly [Caeruleum heppii]|nr:MAG: Cytochrome oxidase assembly [Caeruleum heppii]